MLIMLILPFYISSSVTAKNQDICPCKSGIFDIEVVTNAKNDY